jgi:hypothetical protein
MDPSIAVELSRAIVSRVMVLTVVLSSPVVAQDLEPRAYSASPIDANFLVLGLGRSTGSVIFDPTVPLTDVDATINGATLGLGRTFSLGGKLLLASAALPYTWGEVEGLVAEESRRVTRSGLADMRLRVSVNVRGTPALKAADFAKAPPRTTIGTSLTVVAPIGQYDGHKLINLGSNRWAFKPEVGVSHPVGRWHVDGYAGVWLFTSNDRFYPGESLRAQGPVVALQGHVSRGFARRAWAAVDATWYSGGRTRVDGGDLTQRQNNARLGATLAMPVGGRQSVKIAFSTGASTRTGADFSTLAVGWQVVWIDRPRPRPVTRQAYDRP